MDKTEFIATLKAMPFVDDVVGSPKLEGTNEAGDKFYYVNVRFIKDNTVRYHNIYYVILHEGEAEEAVYFKDIVPTEVLLDASIGDKLL